MQIRIEGPAVTPLQTGFAQNWLQTTGELISGPLFYPLLEPAGPLAAQTIMSSPEIGASTVRIMYYLSIICARRSIYIANPYFLPDAAAHRRARSRRRAAAWTCGSWWPASTTTTGSRARTACACSARCSRPGSRSSNTTARCSITRRWWWTRVWATIGTTNFDNRSFAHNEENNVCCCEHAFARSLHEMFEADIAACDRVELAAWKRRGLWQRTQEVFAAFLEEQT